MSDELGFKYSGPSLARKARIEDVIKYVRENNLKLSNSKDWASAITYLGNRYPEVTPKKIREYVEIAEKMINNGKETS